MSELSHALNAMKNLPLCVMQFPSGTWGFVGKVPVVLKWETDEPELIKTAMRSGEGIAKAIAKNTGKVFKTCTWVTKAEAIAAATSAGFTVAE